MHRQLSSRSVDHTDTPSIPYYRLSDDDKRRFAARRPNEALVLETLSKTGKDIDVEFLRVLKTLNNVLLDVLPADDAAAVMGSHKYHELHATRLTEDTWRIERAPIVFEVYFDSCVVTVDCSFFKCRVDVSATASNTDDSTFASTTTPVATVAVPRVYSDGRKKHEGARRFVVVDATAAGTVIQFLKPTSHTPPPPSSLYVPDLLRARVVPESRTSSFARFVVPAIEVYAGLARDGLSYVTKTFHACQAMCGFKQCDVQEFLRDATSVDGVVTTEYTGSAFHSACDDVVKTFSSCLDVVRMDAVRKHFKPRPGTSFVNVTMMSMVRMHVVGGGCSDTACPARSAALTASALRQRLAGLSPGAVGSSSTTDTTPANTGISHIVGVLVRSFKQYMLLPSSVHVDVDSLFSTGDGALKALSQSYIQAVRESRELAPSVSLAALPTVPSYGTSMDAAWNVMDAIAHTTRLATSCALFSKRLHDGGVLDAATSHLYDAATSCIASDFAKESLLCRLVSIPGMTRSRHAVAVARAVEDLTKRHTDLQRVVVSMYDTLGTSATSTNVPETSQLTGLCCAVASVGAALRKLITMLDGLLKAVRDTAFGTLRRELLTFAVVADRVYGTRKRLEICKRMTAMGGQTPCASVGPALHSQHEWRYTATGRKHIVCTHEGCTDVHATQRLLDDTTCFSCAGRCFDLPTESSWVYFCNCCREFFGSSADFECSAEDGTDGAFVVCDVPFEFDAMRKPVKTRRTVLRVLPNADDGDHDRYDDDDDDAADDDHDAAPAAVRRSSNNNENIAIEKVVAQHANKCARACGRDVGYNIRRSAFITCATCSLPVFVAAAAPATCPNLDCAWPYGRPGCEQYAVNDVSGDSICMACGVVRSERALSSEPFKVNHDSDVENGTNNVQNGGPLDRRASIQLSTSLSTPYGGGGVVAAGTKASFASLLEMHRLSERAAIIRGPAEARTTAFLRDTHKRAFFELVTRYLDKHVITADSAEWAKDVFTDIRETDQLLRPANVQAAIVMMAVLKSADAAKRWRDVASTVQWTCGLCGLEVTAGTSATHKTTCVSTAAVQAREQKRFAERDAALRARKRAKAATLQVLDL